MKNIIKNTTLMSYYVVQLIILGLCFFAYTSTIEVFPWYEPLTMGPFIGIMLLIPVQGFIALIIVIFRKRLLINNNINVISNINIIILIFTLIITIIKEELFYPIAKLFAIVECLLVIYFIIKIIKSLIKIKNNSYF